MWGTVKQCVSGYLSCRRVALQHEKGPANLALVLIAAVAALVLPQCTAAVPVKEVRRVLIFNDLGLWSPGTAAINNEIFAALENSPYQVEFYGENLDTSLFPDEVSQRQFREWYFRKYTDRKPDLIIAVGPSALKLTADIHDQFSPDTPVVFCGITEELSSSPKIDSHFTGVWDVVQPGKTLDAALHLQPGTKHVVVAGGVAPFDRHIEALVRQAFRDYESRLDFTYLTDLAMPTLLEQLKHLSSQTIVYHTSIMQDAVGTHFIDASESAPLVAAAANAPVFIVDDVDFGTGAVGGDLYSYTLQGRQVAEMASRILKGEKPQNIPIVKNANVYMFDWRALRRWGLKESDLPPGSIVLNRQPTFWESYRWPIIGGISLMVAETLLIFGLLWQRTRRRKAETELAVTYDRLRLAVEAGKSIGWDWNITSGRVSRFGDLQTVFGIQSSTFFGDIEDFRRRVHPEDRELVWKALGEARRNRTPYAAEFRVVRDDRAVRWITASGKFYYAKNGAAERMLGMAVDITDRKLAEQKLYESQEQLAGIVGSAMDAIIAFNEEQRVVLFNTAAEKMFGCTAAEAIGSTCDRFIPQGLRAEHQAHVRCFGESGVTTRAMGVLSALWATRVNGQEFPIEASISHVQADEKNLFTVIIRDITERRRVEEVVRESEQRFRLVANTAPVMIWMSDPDKLCNYFNQPWLEFTGRPMEAEVGNGWAEGVYPEDLKLCLDTYTQAFDLRESFKMQYRLRRYDGEYRWVLDRGVPRFNPDGSFAGYIGSCIDVTDRKLAEDALAGMSRKLIEAHEEERTWIARELHDDINQRIALMAIELERWDQHFCDSDVDGREHIRSVRERLFDLGKDVQALSHRLHSSKLEILGLVAAARSFCKEFAGQHKVEIDFSDKDVPRNVPKEISLCLFRVLQEALQNALKHSGVQHFSVAMHGRSGEIQMEVSDLGVGFTQHDTVNHDGLGLISMRERLQMVKGELSIKSEPSSGTTIQALVRFSSSDHASAAV